MKLISERHYMEMLVFTMYPHILSIYIQVDWGHLIFQLQHVYSKTVFFITLVPFFY